MSPIIHPPPPSVNGLTIYKIAKKSGLTLYTLPLAYLVKPCIIVSVRQGRKPLTKGSEDMTEGMTNAEFNAFLETLAQLIEAKAATPEEAAQIVREAKAK